MQANGISSMAQLYEKVEAMNSGHYELRGKIVTAERCISALFERLEMWAQYQRAKPVRQRLDKVKPSRRGQYQQEHESELAFFDAAVRFLDDLKESDEEIRPKEWQAEIDRLTAQKDLNYQKIRAMRDDLKTVERLKKTAEQLAREGQTQRREEQER